MYFVVCTDCIPTGQLSTRQMAASLFPPKREWLLKSRLPYYLDFTISRNKAYMHGYFGY